LATSWANGLIELNWRTDLPFTIGSDATVTRGADTVPSGARITAINGQPIDDLAEAEATIAAVARVSDGMSAPLSLAWVGADSDSEMITKLAAPIIYHTAFENGLAFETHYADQTWVTKVVDAPSDLNMELQVGDEIVALVPDNERISGGASLAEITSEALMQDRNYLKFAVRRDDALWIADLTVAGDQG
ncbi:MAG: hypothetical protein AAF801_17270, partial [Pseudomonadota bacterium]